MMVSRKGSNECVKILAPYEMGLKDINGCTALKYAILNNHLDCASLLIDEAKTTMNDDLWFLSAEKCFSEILSLYVD